MAVDSRALLESYRPAWTDEGIRIVGSTAVPKTRLPIRVEFPMRGSAAQYPNLRRSGRGQFGICSSHSRDKDRLRSRYLAAARGAKEGRENNRGPSLQWNVNLDFHGFASPPSYDPSCKPLNPEINPSLAALPEAKQIGLCNGPRRSDLSDPEWPPNHNPCLLPKPALDLASSRSQISANWAFRSPFWASSSP